MKHFLMLIFLMIGSQSRAADSSARRDDFLNQQAIPLVKAFIQKHRIAFDANFSFALVRNYKEVTSSDGSGSVIINASNLSFMILKNAAGIGAITWFQDDKECTLPRLQDASNINLMKSLARQTNVLNVNSALLVAKNHFMIEGFSPSDFQAPSVNQLTWGWPGSTNYLRLPYYHVRWVLNGVSDSGSDIVPEVEIDVSGICSNVVGISEVLMRKELDALKHARRM